MDLFEEMDETSSIGKVDEDGLSYTRGNPRNV